MPREHDKQAHRRVALERIDSLFEQARKVFSKEPALAKRYVTLARKIQSRYKVRMPAKFRYRYCKKCGSYWMPGASVRVRTRVGKVVFTCLVCKAMRRKPYS
jgi:ribonuclease P protein subunit RPR2